VRSQPGAGRWLNRPAPRRQQQSQAPSSMFPTCPNRSCSAVVPPSQWSSGTMGGAECMPKISRALSTPRSTVSGPRRSRRRPAGVAGTSAPSTAQWTRSRLPSMTASGHRADRGGPRSVITTFVLLGWGNGRVVYHDPPSDHHDQRRKPISWRRGGRSTMGDGSRPRPTEPLAQPMATTGRYVPPPCASYRPNARLAPSSLTR